MTQSRFDGFDLSSHGGEHPLAAQRMGAPARMSTSGEVDLECGAC